MVNPFLLEAHFCFRHIFFVKHSFTISASAVDSVNETTLTPDDSIPFITVLLRPLFFPQKSKTSLKKKRQKINEWARPENRHVPQKRSTKKRPVFRLNRFDTIWDVFENLPCVRIPAAINYFVAELASYIFHICFNARGRSLETLNSLKRYISAKKGWKDLFF